MAKHKFGSSDAGMAGDQPSSTDQPTSNRVIVYRRDHPGNRCSYGIAGVPGIVVFDKGLFADGVAPASITLDCELAVPKADAKAAKAELAAARAVEKAAKAQARIDAAAVKAAERKVRAEEAAAKAKARADEAERKAAEKVAAASKATGDQHPS